MDEKPKIQHFKPAESLQYPGATAGETATTDGPDKNTPPPKKPVNLNPEIKIPHFEKFVLFLGILLPILINVQFIWGILHRTHIYQSIEPIFITIWDYITHQPYLFALGVVVLGLIHELGHLIVLLAFGQKLKPKHLIPYVGAKTAIQENETDPVIQMYTAFGGPILGGAAAFGCLMVFNTTGQSLFLALAEAGFVLNMLNLIPFKSFDGAKMVQCYAKWIMVSLLGFVIFHFLSMPELQPIMLLFLAIIVIRLFEVLFKPKDPDDPLQTIPILNKIFIGLGYILLACVLYTMSLQTYDIIKAHPLQ